MDTELATYIGANGESFHAIIVISYTNYKKTIKYLSVGQMQRSDHFNWIVFECIFIEHMHFLSIQKIYIH